ncbi:group II intron maturase-specific domain-containing protein [Thiocystis violacea]|uniref:group II intron maturase-specific domain-containing protein n=1 Tax=Thiocystis violacea TaxID=13725 RepID=UPI0019058D5A|nr:group II intron maturase-specific domain-containing protein [Thiocystis violacea]MBK1725213.1 hypothetical protein [Thiocystis violacea]
MGFDENWLSSRCFIRYHNPRRSGRAIIRGWSNYHAGQVSKDIYSKVDHETWKALWQWAKRAHPNKGKRWIKERYFHQIEGKNWVFGYWEKTESGAKQFKRLSTHAETSIRRHVKIKADANPFDTEWEAYFEQRATNAMRKRPNGRIKSLWLRQGGICPICKQIIQPDGEQAVHHVVAQTLGGKDTLDNLRLLHGNCHRLVHVKHELSALPALL